MRRRLDKSTKGPGARLIDQERPQPFCGVCQILPESGQFGIREAARRQLANP